MQTTLLVFKGGGGLRNFMVGFISTQVLFFNQPPYVFWNGTLSNGRGGNGRWTGIIPSILTKVRRYHLIFSLPHTFINLFFIKKCRPTVHLNTTIPEDVFTVFDFQYFFP